MPQAASIPSPASAATAIPSPTPATTATPAAATTPSPVPIAALPSPAGPSPAPAPLPPAPSATPPAIRAPRPGLALRHDDITTDPDHHLDPDDLPEPATDPDGRPPRHETDELVSPAFDPDRSPLPPPLPPEVWTSATERRSAPRVPCTLRVEVEADGERALLTTRDLSVTGVFVFAPRVRPPGARLALVLHLGRGRLSLTGRVVHALPGVGYGVRFDGPDPGLRRRIERYLSQTEDRARAD